MLAWATFANVPELAAPFIGIDHFPDPVVNERIERKREECYLTIHDVRRVVP